MSLLDARREPTTTNNANGAFDYRTTESNETEERRGSTTTYDKTEDVTENHQDADTRACYGPRYGRASLTREERGVNFNRNVTARLNEYP